MKHLITLGFMLIIGVSSFAQKRKAEQDTKNWRYEIEGIGEGKEGTYLVKVWSYNKKDKIAVEQAKKNAVHGIVFQGFTGSGKVSSQPPLVTDPDIKIAKADFFDAFFKDNNKDGYMKYVSLSNDGSISPDDILKVGKEYKIGVIVSIRKDLLKKDLKTEGIVKSLDSGF
jgi:hypothetical protein